jgi:hypothetical protein
MNVHELYEQTIKSLPAAERLRLAVLILNDIPPQSVVGVHTTSVQNLSLTYYTHNSLAVSEDLFCV